MRKGRDIGSVVFFTVVGIIALFIGAMMFFPQQMSHFFHFRHYVVISNSMEPVINVNDAVIVQKVEPSSLNVGDIITFKMNIDEDEDEEYVTHYIAEIENDKFRTKPNISNSWDRWIVPSEKIEGKVVLVIPKIGALLILMYNNAVPLLLVANALVIITIIRVYFDKDEKEADES
ncbi:signal peptidase I [Erysipelothrix sp. HDW6C]|uniref:signal peptidase I n=1 Tax=Erysipelothrix sp. HDW6C TaxID=2714930 RepID=UPI00140E381D|nr:signal peptidase I [Erysipelothrix sp. HDW6C]QIK69663.1 signal peptidase I [Erysipelothrix sp. HDW6C]